MYDIEDLVSVCVIHK